MRRSPATTHRLPCPRPTLEEVISPEPRALSFAMQPATPEALPPVTPTPSQPTMSPQEATQRIQSLIRFASQSPTSECIPLPPVLDDIYGHRSSLLPRWLNSPYETPLFVGPLAGYPAVTRPVIGPPLLNCAPNCGPSPMFVPPPSAVPYMRGPTRYGLTAPVPPGGGFGPCSAVGTNAELRRNQRCHASGGPSIPRSARLRSDLPRQRLLARSEFRQLRLGPQRQSRDLWQ